MRKRLVVSDSDNAIRILSEKSPGFAGAVVELPTFPTPRMLGAGAYEAREHALGESLRDLAKKIYIAMAVEGSSTTMARYVGLEELTKAAPKPKAKK